MGGVHVRLDLEDEARELRIGRLDRRTVHAQSGSGRRRQPDEGVEELVHTDLGHRRSEEGRRQLASEHLGPVERIARRLQELDLLAHLGGHLAVHRSALPGLVEESRHALEVLALAERPGDGAGPDAQHLLHLVEVVERLPAQPIHLVHEGEDGDAPPAADLEQLAGLRLHSLGAVDQHHRGVGGGQRPVGILRKVLVPRGIEQVDAEPLVLELQHRAGHGNPALPLQLHPVGRDVPLRPPRLHGPGEMDRPAMQEQLFSERGLPGIGMRNDRKRPPPEGLRSELLLFHQVPVVPVSIYIRAGGSRGEGRRPPGGGAAGAGSKSQPLRLRVGDHRKAASIKYWT